MMPGKRFRLFAVALFAIFTGLSTYCYGETCGFDSNCPYIMPPCYEVTIVGHTVCPDCPTEFLANGTWIISYQPIEENCYYEGYTNHEPIPYKIMLSVIADGNTTFMTSNSVTGFYCDESVSSNGVGSCVNTVGLDNCCHHLYYSRAYGGSASWKPMWDCNACDAECTLDVNSSPDTTIYYANEDCCPAASKGDRYTVTIDCDSNCSSGTIYVVPEVGPYDANLVTVEYDPSCREATKASFDLQALSGSGDPNTFTEVTCTASFFCSITGMGSGSTTVTVRPHCGECCEEGKEGFACSLVAGSI